MQLSKWLLNVNNLISLSLSLPPPLPQISMYLSSLPLWYGYVPPYLISVCKHIYLSLIRLPATGINCHGVWVQALVCLLRKHSNYWQMLMDFKKQKQTLVYFLSNWISNLCACARKHARACICLSMFVHVSVSVCISVCEKNVGAYTSFINI